ncbi:VWA domain-containing protein [Sulfurimonas sp. SWIR-19]|uniref:vWA domain-containing protein n=1 Tax=Sulfurimonas sp. SWIR-19 TaxID=2878390 RepID=UPI001CF45689|nr:VWA domain-containing protein [Sulfurimonas sp. SWIR-19]UCM99713.1 VWA domain-containing protein [Sulfurimonas sp. SWIR-19]
MTLLYPWVLSFLIPLYFYYKNDIKETQQKTKRQKNLLYLSLFFMLLALSRPVIINKPIEQKFDAQDYIIALDASFSMQADDLKPTRYEVAKKNIASLLRQLNQDRFSIFAFTSNAMLISPPTTDSTISMMALNSLAPKYILTKGTSLLSLFQSIAKTSYKQKNLIIFTDGGEDKDLASLVSICKKNSIIPYIVATGSNRGTTLKKGNKPILDNNENLVISRINPLLKSLAQECGGKYYELNSAGRDVAKEIINDLAKQDTTIQSSTKVLSYQELFVFPLSMAILSFFLSVTKLHQLFVFLPLLLMPYPVHATSLLDFYHYKKAQATYKQKHYTAAAQEFLKLSPSVESYYNSAVAYYKAKNYKKAVALFSQIHSPNPKLKQNIFYNLGNCAVALKKYSRAKQYYQKSLALGFDKDTFDNLMLLYKLGLQDEKKLAQILPKNSKQQKKQPKQKHTQKKNTNQSSASNSQQKASQKSSGSGKNSKKKRENQNLLHVKKKNKSKYKLGYRAYELINKGYTNEKHPW